MGKGEKSSQGVTSDKSQPSPDPCGGTLEYKLYQLEARGWAFIMLQPLLVLGVNRQNGARSCRADPRKELQVLTAREKHA